MNKKLIKENFFEAVNGEWLAKHKIPDNKSTIGSFERLDEGLTKLKTSLLLKWSVDTREIEDNKELLEMVKLYQLANNWNERKKNGIKPVLSILKEIEELNSWADVEKNYKNLTLRGFEVPIPFMIEQKKE